MIAFILCLFIAGVWGDCKSDVQSCMDTFHSKINADSSNLVQSCQDGDDVLSCLRQRDSRPDCSMLHDQIQDQIQTATSKLVASGCNPSGGADACLTGVQTCENNLRTGISGVDKSDKEAQCRVAQTFLTCLRAIQCSGPHEAKVTASANKVIYDERMAHCV